jgi:hypothetical protein
MLDPVLRCDEVYVNDLPEVCNLFFELKKL